MMTPNSIISLNMTGIFKWYVVRRAAKNKNQKDMCSKETAVHAQNMITILGSIMTIIFIWEVDLHDHLMSIKMFTLIMNEIFI